MKGHKYNIYFGHINTAVDNCYM